MIDDLRGWLPDPDSDLTPKEQWIAQHQKMWGCTVHQSEFAWETMAAEIVFEEQLKRTSGYSLEDEFEVWTQHLTDEEKS